MKKTNTLFAFLLGLVVLMASSCLDSDNGGEQVDGAEYVVIDDPLLLFDVQGDSGTYYKIVNPEVMRLKTQDGKDYRYERAELWFAYTDKEEIATSGITPSTRKIKVLRVTPIPVNSLNTASDTLKLGEIKYNPFYELVQPWGNSTYINTPFATYYSKGLSVDNFTLFVEEASGNKLNLRLLDTRQEKDVVPMQAVNMALSFKLPPAGYFTVGDFNLDISDSVLVTIRAEEKRIGEIKVFKPFKIKF